MNGNQNPAQQAIRLHNAIIKGRYSMLTQGYLLNGDPNNPNNAKQPYYIPYAVLATVTYDGTTGSDGSGGIAGSGVLKFVDNEPTLPGPEPLDLKEFAIIDGSRYWIDANEVSGRAVFLAKLYSGDVHTIHYFFIIEDRGKTIKFMSTKSEPSNSVQWGSQTRISRRTSL